MEEKLSCESQGVDFLYDLEEELYNTVMESVEDYSSPHELETFKRYFASSITCLVLSILQHMGRVAASSFHLEKFESWWTHPITDQIVNFSGKNKDIVLGKLIQYAVFGMSLSMFSGCYELVSLIGFPRQVTVDLYEIISFHELGDLDRNDITWYSDWY